jgi:CheY-like chemotaxis protein
MDIDDSVKVLSRLEEISRAAEHSRDITMRLLAFSRRQVINPQALDANQIIAESLKSLSRLIGEHILITFAPDETLWSALIDPVQLDQIVMNMAVNARDAMPDGGSFVIKTANFSMGKDSCTPGSDRIPGDYVQISFEDSGFGMDQETLSHVFEPFFTTKEVGKGTGLGLATIYGIISQNNGFIDVVSAPGSGTVFKVYLPRHASPSAGITKSDAAICPGSSTILLVEDEEAVREVTALFLRKIGYTVYEAESPGKALELVRDFSIPLDLVLTDFIMPEMNGKVLMERIREIRKDIKYMYASGHATDPDLLSEASQSGVDLIQKPYDLKNLSECLIKVITREEIRNGKDFNH